jgi:hypothetical protein
MHLPLLPYGLSGRAAPTRTPAPSGQPASPRPSFVVEPDAVYVTDPTKGEIVEVNVASAASSRRIAVGGQPTNLAVVVATGLAHQ